jgi:GH24 family phage-related lysozyme (muramidase)
MRTEIIVVLDKSGSMGSVKDDTIGAYNGFLEDQKKQPGECGITLVTFDFSSQTLYQGGLVGAHPLTPVNYVPGGGTALLDAVGDTIESCGKRFDDRPADKKPQRVICVILTDGQENASRRRTRQEVFAMIQEQTNTWGWIFTYLGANVDAFAEASKMGIPTAQAINFDHGAVGVRNVVAALSGKVSSDRVAGNYAYSSSDRDAANATGGGGSFVGAALMDLVKLRTQLINEEGFRQFPYRDTQGLLTIGYGRNLDGNGISRAEATFLFDNDVDRVIRQLQEFYWFDQIEVRQRVLVDMVYNLGLSRFLGFTRMLLALKAGDFDRAADEMLDSLWAHQTGARAWRLAQMMRTGLDPQV